MMMVQPQEIIYSPLFPIHKPGYLQLPVPCFRSHAGIPALRPARNKLIPGWNESLRFFFLTFFFLFSTDALSYFHYLIHSRISEYFHNCRLYIDNDQTSTLCLGCFGSQYQCTEPCTWHIWYLFKIDHVMIIVSYYVLFTKHFFEQLKLLMNNDTYENNGILRFGKHFYEIIPEREKKILEILNSQVIV